MNQTDHHWTAGLWILLVTLLLTALVCLGMVTIGIDSQWKYGLMRDAETPMAPIPPSYGNIWIAVLGLAAQLGVVHFGLARIRAAHPVVRTLLVSGLVAAGMLQLFGLIVVSRAGIGEPSLVHFCDWSGGFFNDAVRLRAKSDPVSGYSQYQADLSLHGRWHPPGPMLMNLWAIRYFEARPKQTEQINEAFRSQGVHLQGSWWLIQKVGEEMGHPPAPEVRESDIAACHLMAWVLLVIASSCMIPVYLLGKELVDEECGFAAAGFYAAIPALCFFQPMMDLVYALFTVWALWFHARGLGSERAWIGRLWFAAGGATLGLGLFFSYNQLAVLPLVAIWTATEQWRRQQESLVGLLAVGCAIVVGLAIACLGVLALANYDLMRDFLTRDVGRSWDWGTKLGLEPTIRPYATWLWMNLVEFATFTGIPIAIGLAFGGGRGVVATLKRSADRGQALAAALIVGLLLLDLTGVNRSEVARLWIFFMPLAAIVASSTFIPHRTRVLLVMIAMWAQALAFKLTLTTNNFFN